MNYLYSYYIYFQMLRGRMMEMHFNNFFFFFYKKKIATIE
jgi:hypothetical protein